MNSELTCDDVWQCEDCCDDDSDDDCICESDKKPNFLCMAHQCCWACSTQKGLIHLNQHLRLWLCDKCNDMGDWCRGCHKLIEEDTGLCSYGCDYWKYEGGWKCDGCNTWREDEKYCAICGPDPADVAADAIDEAENEKESFEEYYEKRKHCRCNAWACDACQYRLRLEDEKPDCCYTCGNIDNNGYTCRNGNLYCDSCESTRRDNINKWCVALKSIFPSSSIV